MILIYKGHSTALETIRFYNHHVFFEPLHSFFRLRVKLLINSSRDFSVHERALSSAKLCNSAFSIQSKRSLMKMLKGMGPKTDPCGTPDNKT